MLKKLFSHKKTLCLAAGALSVLALPPYYMLPLLFISFSWLLLCLSKATSGKQAFAYGYWFGFGWFACGFSWVGNALLIDIAAFGWLYPITLFASGAFFGLFIGAPAYFTYCFKKPYAQWLAFAALWVIFEWIRSFILTGFPWNLLGSVLAFSPQTIQTAALFGTYGLSLLVLLGVSAPTLIFIYRNKISVTIATSTILLISIFIYAFGAWRIQNISDETSDINIRIVQPSIPQAMKWDNASLENNFLEYIRLSKSKPLDNIDFVIWGETATPYPLDIEKYYRELITEAVPPKGYLITGLVRYEFESAYDYRPLNSMFILNKQGEIVDFYDKSHLVPFGEYMPLRKFLPDWIKPITQTVADFKSGKAHKVFKLKNYPSFGALICYEIIFPSEIINPSNKPEFLVNLTNDGWYGDSSGPRQHLVSTQLRAVEEGITIIRAANTGISAVISPIGKIVAFLPLNHKNILDITLPKQLSLPTLYGKYGNFIPLTLCLVNILLALLVQKVKR